MPVHKQRQELLPEDVRLIRSLVDPDYYPSFEEDRQKRESILHDRPYREPKMDKKIKTSLDTQMASLARQSKHHYTDPANMGPIPNANAHQEKAIKLVLGYIFDRGVLLSPNEIHVVWFSKTLQNWKALLSTVHNDGIYYELTYNGDKKETYIDVYLKQDNLSVKDND